jgi:hypothetical protein
VAAIGERGGDALVHGALRRRLQRTPVDDLEGECIGALRQLERDSWDGGGGTMLDREGELLAVAAQESPQAWNSEEPRRA